MAKKQARPRNVRAIRRVNAIAKDLRTPKFRPRVKQLVTKFNRLNQNKLLQRALLDEIDK